MTEGCRKLDQERRTSTDRGTERETPLVSAEVINEWSPLVETQSSYRVQRRGK